MSNNIEASNSKNNSNTNNRYQLTLDDIGTIIQV